MNIKLFLTYTLLLFLTACGGGTADPVVSQPVQASEAQALSLPATVDVQTVASVQNQDNVVLIDVREQWEYDEKHIPNITLIPMSEIAGRLDEIPTDKEIIVTCRSGNRSGQVTEYLQQNGFSKVHNMQGGILAWEKAGYPVEQ